VGFSRTWGAITNGSTGQCTIFHKRNGVYKLDVWVPVPAIAAITDAQTSGGTRQ
jgi:hypothetical protein